MIRVALVNRQKHIRLSGRALRALSAATRAVLRGEKVRHADISVALVDNPTIHRLNRKFLRHNKPTDVITFPLSSEEEAVLSGEIVISGEMARTASRQFGHTERAEIALYLIHGLLHLCGYDDTSNAKRKVMREREMHYMRLLPMSIAGGGPP
jgi:probable rRNA maturation factor